MICNLQGESNCRCFYHPTSDQRIQSKG